MSVRYGQFKHEIPKGLTSRERLAYRRELRKRFVANGLQGFAGYTKSQSQRNRKREFAKS